METKAFKFELKTSDDERCEFTGFASTYGNEDLVGDIVTKGAFTQTIRHNDGEVPILWQHDQTQPIGMGKLEDSASGLKIHGRLYLDSPKAKEAMRLMRPMDGFKRAALRSLSIGYDVLKDSVKNGTRFLNELKLYEVSLVTFPANPMANVIGVKGQSLFQGMERRLSAIEHYLRNEGFDAEEFQSKLLDRRSETVEADPHSIVRQLKRDMEIETVRQSLAGVQCERADRAARGDQEGFPRA